MALLGLASGMYHSFMVFCTTASVTDPVVIFCDSITYRLPIIRHAYLLSVSGIPPGQSFTYEVPINASGQWGTYWVHAHAAVSNTRLFPRSIIDTI